MFYLIVLLLGIVVFILAYKYFQLKLNFNTLLLEKTKELFERWKEEEIEADIKRILEEKEKSIRVDAIKRSANVVLGKVAERLAPITAFKKFSLNPKDARFVGDPIDYVVFNGLSEGKVEKIVFAEVKAGDSKLSKSEKQVRDIIKKRKVEWKEIKIA